MKTKPVQLNQPEKKMSATKLIQILKAKRRQFTLQILKFACYMVPEQKRNKVISKHTYGLHS